MPLDITTDFRNELAASIVSPRLFVELETDSSTLRYWTGSFDISWNSQTWSGNGYLKGIGEIADSLDADSSGVSLEFVGEPSAMVSLSLQSFNQNKPCKIYLGFLNSSNSVIADPILLFEGTVDMVNLLDGADKATVTVSIENYMVALTKVVEFRYNSETQKIFYPSDIGFEYMPALEDWNGYWGKPQAANRKPRRKRKNRRRRKP